MGRGMPGPLRRTPISPERETGPAPDPGTPCSAAMPPRDLAGPVRQGGRAAHSPRGSMGPSAGIALPSREPVPDQELHGPVERDLRQVTGPAKGIGPDERRPEAREAQRA